MLLGLSAEEVNDWNNSLHAYEKAKRTKRPFGRTPPTVQRKSTIDVIEKEMKFNPVLQSFRDAREESKTIEQEEIQKANEQIKYLKNNYKYATDYDIITLGHAPALPPAHRSLSLAPEIRKKEHRDPTFQGYNIINGRKYDEGYLQKVGYRPLKHHERNIHPEESRVYNIINGRYASNHEERQRSEQQQRDQQALNKSQQMRVYDSINSRYYNPEVEEEYQAKRNQQELEHSNNSPKLPPSYINRQSFILADHIEPSPIVKDLDRKAELSKQRYKMRQLVDQEYRIRNDYLTDKHEQEAKNRVHLGRVLQQKAREFDIINANRYAENRAEELFGKEITASPYLVRPPPPQHHIKSRGFGQFQQ